MQCIGQSEGTYKTGNETMFDQAQTASQRSKLDLAIFASVVAMSLLSLAALCGLVGADQAVAATPACCTIALA